MRSSALAFGSSSAFRSASAALGLPAGEAAKLLTRRQWREDDVALLRAAAARLGLPVER